MHDELSPTSRPSTATNTDDDQCAPGHPPVDALQRTDLPLPNRRSGKVRDLYDLAEATAAAGRAKQAAASTSSMPLLIIATDRLSAFDVVMPTPFPGKGRLLTQISLRWFKFIADKGIINNHLLHADADRLTMLDEATRGQLRGRIMVCRPCRVVPVECIVRGYLSGSAWKDYQRTGAVCGIGLPTGLRQSDRLPAPIFTPSTKATTGHDENISFESACELVGPKIMHQLRDVSLAIYEAAAAYALSRGLIIADTKFEFGFAFDAPETGELLLVDEALTPDSSRFWPADVYLPGQDQPSFDKQFVRDHLETLVRNGTWDKTPPGPPIPKEIVQQTLAKYAEARDRLWR
ncbi:MAG: phosphoribosylaminoimidazolesuccinocarboxamide synthase [Planctomycetota bacterium]